MEFFTSQTTFRRLHAELSNVADWNESFYLGGADEDDEEEADPFRYGGSGWQWRRRMEGGGFWDYEMGAQWSYEEDYNDALWEEAQGSEIVRQAKEKALRAWLQSRMVTTPQAVLANVTLPPSLKPLAVQLLSTV